MTFIGAKALLEMQSDPRQLIRHHRRPIFFPWRPIPPAPKETGKSMFITTASDLAWWRPFDVKMLQCDLNTLVRLVRPETLTEREVMALAPSVDVYMLDVWCCEESVRASLLEPLLTAMPTINDYVI